MYRSDNLDDVLQHFLKKIQNEGQKYCPRGVETKELIGECFELSVPRNRIIQNAKRKMSITFAIGEFLWYLRGNSKLDVISYYNKNYINYSDDGETLYGSYGERIFNQMNCQWENIKQKLSSDIFSRQAVLSIYNSNDLIKVSKDIPCTCLLQFFIRENKLHCITYMRSNDIMWGLPYDVFNFTMLQELLSTQLGIGLGTYKHFIGSLHLYEMHYKLADEILKNPVSKINTMKEMPFTDKKDIENILKVEEQLRKGDQIEKIDLGEYWNDFISVLIYKRDKIRYGEINSIRDYKMPEYFEQLVK